MAGTDHTREAALGGPAVVLVEPQLGENIGAAARAMLNVGLTDLRLVRPRDGWPSEAALSAAAAADWVVDGARLFDGVAAAIDDARRVYACTARPRDMAKPMLTAEAAAAEMRAFRHDGEGCAWMFGPERAGLGNDEVALADALVTVPLNPAFASLNLAQAVLLVGYAWLRAGDGGEVPAEAPAREPPATKSELIGLFEHLEGELDAAGFHDNRERRPVTVRKIRNMLQRADLRDFEVRTLRGVIAALSARRRS